MHYLVGWHYTMGGQSLAIDKKKLLVDVETKLNSVS